jgi:cobalt-zinc-cadmium efflux system protein
MGGRHRKKKDAVERGLRRSQWTNGALAAAIAAAAVASGSTMLLAEALHNGLDAVSDGLSRIAHRVSGKPADSRFTVGRGKAIPLAALGSAVTMMLTSAGVGAEAVAGFLHPVAVNTAVMGAAPVVSLAANLFITLGFRGGASLLFRSLRRRGTAAEHDLARDPHAYGSFMHALGDMKGSLGVMLAAAVIRLTGWSWVDPAAALAVAWSAGMRPAWKLARKSIAKLMDAAPVDGGVVERAILRAPGVERAGRLEVTEPNWDGVVEVKAKVQVRDGIELDTSAIKRVIDPLVREELEKEGMTLAPTSSYLPIHDDPGPLYHALPRRAGAPSHGHGHDHHHHEEPQHEIHEGPMEL